MAALCQYMSKILKIKTEKLRQKIQISLLLCVSVNRDK